MNPHRSARRSPLVVLLSVVVLIIIFAGCAGEKAADTTAAKLGAPGAAGFTPPPVPVEVQTIEAQDVQYSLAAVGTLQAREIIRVPARVAGVIQDVAFQEGQAVTPGRVLARIDPEQVAQARGMIPALRHDRRFDPPERAVLVSRQAAGE